MSQYLTSNSSETKKIGKSFAKKALSLLKKREKSFILGLKGDLGGGKTTFLQGFAEGLGIKEKILSPTFIIYRRYNIGEGDFYHFDCYRIKDSEEIKELGFEKIINQEGNIVALEWADKIKEIMPKDTIWINFSFKGKEKRKIEIVL
jgi:tRNA threonylcarbamoyladenosine biosynthesis protein TsaE